MIVFASGRDDFCMAVLHCYYIKLILLLILLLSWLLMLLLVLLLISLIMLLSLLLIGLLSFLFLIGDFVVARVVDFLSIFLLSFWL